MAEPHGKPIAGPGGPGLLLSCPRPHSGGCQPAFSEWSSHAPAGPAQAMTDLIQLCGSCWVDWRWQRGRSLDKWPLKWLMNSRHTLSRAHGGLTPEALGTQRRAGVPPGSHTDPWLRRSAGTGSEDGADAKHRRLVGTCSRSPAGQCLLKPRYQHAPWALRRSQVS